MESHLLVHLLLLASCYFRLCLGQSGVLITVPHHPKGLNVAYIPSNSTIRVDRVLAPPPTTPPTTTTSTSTTTTTAPSISTTTGPSSSSGTTPTSTTPQSTVPTTPALPPMVGPINIVFAGIRELDNNSMEVSGHSLYDFSQLMPLAPGSQPADCLNLSASFPPLGNSTFTLSLCPSSQNKTFNVNETIPVMDGQLVFSISVQGWPWGVGKYLELNLTLGLQEGRKVTDLGASAGQPMKLGLGVADAYAIFSTVVTDGSNYIKMPAGYPKLTQFSPEGPRANVTLRLPRSTTSNAVMYDTVVVEPGYTAQSKLQPVAAAPRFFQQTTTWMTTVLFLLLSVFVGRF